MRQHRGSGSDRKPAEQSVQQSLAVSKEAIQSHESREKQHRDRLHGLFRVFAPSGNVHAIHRINDFWRHVNLQKDWYEIVLREHFRYDREAHAFLDAAAEESFHTDTAPFEAALTDLSLYIIARNAIVATVRLAEKKGLTPVETYHEMAKAIIRRQDAFRIWRVNSYLKTALRVFSMPLPEAEKEWAELVSGWVASHITATTPNGSAKRLFKQLEREYPHNPREGLIELELLLKPVFDVHDNCCQQNKA